MEIGLLEILSVACVIAFTASWHCRSAVLTGMWFGVGTWAAIFIVLLVFVAPLNWP